MFNIQRDLWLRRLLDGARQMPAKAKSKSKRGREESEGGKNPRKSARLEGKRAAERRPLAMVRVPAPNAAGESPRVGTVAEKEVTVDVAEVSQSEVVIGQHCWSIVVDGSIICGPKEVWLCSVCPPVERYMCCVCRCWIACPGGGRRVTAFCN